MLTALGGDGHSGGNQGRGHGAAPRALWPHPFADVHFDHSRKPPRVATVLRLESNDVAGSVAAVERVARQLEAVDSPHVACIRAVECDAITQRITVLTDPIAGVTAAQARDRGVMSPPQLLSCLRQVATALAEAHRVGVLHLTLGPASVILSVTGEVRVTDFGLAGLLPAQPRHLRLHPFSPEAVLGLPRGPAEDIYLFGALAYFLVSGTPPLVDDDAGRLRRRHAIEEPPPLSGAPAQLTRLITRCLAKEPEDRFADMAAVLAALEGAARAPGAAVSPARGATATNTPRARATPPNRSTVRAMPAVVDRTSPRVPVVDTRVEPEPPVRPPRTTPVVVSQTLLPQAESEPPATPVLDGDPRLEEVAVSGAAPDSSPIHIEVVDVPAPEAAPEIAAPTAPSELAAASPAISSAAVPTFIPPDTLPRRPTDSMPVAPVTESVPVSPLLDLPPPSELSAWLRVISIACVVVAVGGGLWAWIRVANLEEDTAGTVEAQLRTAVAGSPDEVQTSPAQAGASATAAVPGRAPAAAPLAEAAALKPAPGADRVEAAIEGEETIEIDDDLPDDIRVSQLLAQAKAARRQGRASDAVAHYKDALAVAPQNVEALSTLARLAFDRGDFREAVHYGKRTVAERPGSGKARIALGDAFFKQGDRRRAEEQYQRAKSLGYDLASRRLEMITQN